MIIMKTLKAGGAGIFKPFSLAESLLTGGIAAAVSGFGHEKPKGVRAGLRKWPHVDPKHGRGKNGAAKNFGVGLKIGGGYAASHGMTIEEQGKGAGRGDHNLCYKIVKRLGVALKVIDMDHTGVVGIAEGSAVPRVIGKVNLIPEGGKIEDDLLVFFNAFTKAMADYHGAYRALGKVGFVVETIGPCEIAVFTGGKRALLTGAVLQGKIALKANLFQKGENICIHGFTEIFVCKNALLFHRKPYLHRLIFSDQGNDLLFVIKEEQDPA